jgi:hypothetical protein
MMPTPERDTGMMAKTPAERWSALTGTPDGKASRKEVMHRFITIFAFIIKNKKIIIRTMLGIMA